MTRDRSGVDILTTAPDLAPLGGIEQCTLQDVTTLAERGSSVAVLFERDGPQRRQYEVAGAHLSGPFSFAFDFDRPWAAIRRFWPAARAVRTMRPRLLWLNRSEHIVWAQAVARYAGVPIVCQLHQSPNFMRVALLYRGVGLFVAVSEFTRQQWIARGIRPDRVVVLPNAVSPLDYPPAGEPELESARRTLGLPPHGPIVLSYGTISVGKGSRTLLRAWRRLAQEAHGGTLVLVGSPSPWQDPELAAELSSLPDGSYRVFPQQSDVVPFLHAADIVAFPSLLDEAFGRVVIEGLATGRPVIASSVGGVPEILFGEMTRFLVEPDNDAELAERLRGLLAWRTDQPELGRACSDWVADHFSWEDRVARLERLLSDR